MGSLPGGYRWVMGTIVGGIALSLFGLFFAVVGPVLAGGLKDRSDYQGEMARRYGTPSPWLYRIFGLAFCAAGVAFAVAG
jgi:hypothetical protein